LPRHRRNGLIIYAPVAQLDRAPDFESVGRVFEPHRARHIFPIIIIARGQPTSRLALFAIGSKEFVEMAKNKLGVLATGRKATETDAGYQLRVREPWIL
jgi:hypothetical protein